MKKTNKLPKDIATARDIMMCVTNLVRWQIIELLDEHRQLRPTDLQRLLSKPQASIGAHLKKLAKNSLVGKETIRYGEVYYYLLPRFHRIRNGIKELNRA